jgi:hypothetical protein
VVVRLRPQKNCLTADAARYKPRDGGGGGGGGFYKGEGTRSGPCATWARQPPAAAQRSGISGRR